MCFIKQFRWVYIVVAANGIAAIYDLILYAIIKGSLHSNTQVTVTLGSGLSTSPTHSVPNPQSLTTWDCSLFHQNSPPQWFLASVSLRRPYLVETLETVGSNCLPGEVAEIGRSSCHAVPIKNMWI
jgi:hypothetical protein